MKHPKNKLNFIFNFIFLFVSKEMTFEPLRDFENDYEIEIEEPHRIRRIGSNRFLKTSMQRDTGYIQICLNGRTYRLHRILARHFLPNPDDLPEIDHIDRDKTNNTLDNLRWVSRSENVRNRGQFRHQRREYLNAPPNDITEIRTFNDAEYEENKYFFCYENDKVVQRYSDHKWQLLAEHRIGGYLRISMRDVNGRQHHVYVHKLIDHFRNEQAEDEENEEYEE